MRSAWRTPPTRLNRQDDQVNLFPRMNTLCAALMMIASASAIAGGDIRFSAHEAYPEGVAHSAKDKVFLVSSMRYGTIGRVTPGGEYRAFIDDDKLISSVGMLFDKRHNALWVAISDPGLSTRSTDLTKNRLAAVAVYDASSGKRRAYHDLGALVEGGHFANDLTIDPDGNVYVTDSFSPVIYRVDAKGRKSVFATSDLFKGEGFNLNGIVYHPDGYLLVAKYNSGELFRVSIGDPKRVEPVALAEPLKGADGLVLKSNSQLTVIQNQGADSVVELQSSNGWQTAKIASRSKSSMSFPTTGARVGKSIYVLNARLDTLLDPKAQKANEYLLQKFDD